MIQLTPAVWSITQLIKTSLPSAFHKGKVLNAGCRRGNSALFWLGYKQQSIATGCRHSFRFDLLYCEFSCDVKKPTNRHLEMGLKHPTQTLQLHHLPGSFLGWGAAFTACLAPKNWAKASILIVGNSWWLLYTPCTAVRINPALKHIPQV